MKINVLRSGWLFACALALLLPAGAHGAIILYGLSPFFSSERLYTFNTTSGAPTSIGLTNRNTLGGVAADNSGRLMSFDAGAAFGQLNAATGAFTQLAQYSGTFFEGDIAVDPTTNLAYIVEESDMYRINLTTNAITSLGKVTVGGVPMSSDTNIDGLAFRGGDMYGLITIQTPGLNGHLVRIDKNTLALTDVGNTGQGFGSTAGLAYDPTTDVFYAAGSSNAGLYRLNPGTGAATLVGNHNLAEVSGLTIIVPEPESLALAAAVLLTVRRRDSRAAGA